METSSVVSDRISTCSPGDEFSITTRVFSTPHGEPCPRSPPLANSTPPRQPPAFDMRVQYLDAKHPGTPGQSQADDAPRRRNIARVGPPS